MAKKQTTTLEEALQVILATDGDNPLLHIPRVSDGDHLFPKIIFSLIRIRWNCHGRNHQ